MADGRATPPLQRSTAGPCLYLELVGSGPTTEATVTALLLLLALGQAAAKPAAPGLLFGFAKRAITPAIGAKPVYLAGFDNDRRATGVHDDLWGRAVAVSDGRLKVAIVSVDLIGVFHGEVLKAREELQRRVPGAVLVVASTHNHQGPDTMGLWGKGRFSSGVDPEYLGRVREEIAAAAADALSAEAGPARPRPDAHAGPHRGRPAAEGGRRHARGDAGDRRGRRDARHGRRAGAAIPRRWDPETRSSRPTTLTTSGSAWRRASAVRASSSSARSAGS